jgi:hypothetical protein
MYGMHGMCRIIDEGYRTNQVASLFVYLRIRVIVEV